MNKSLLIFWLALLFFLFCHPEKIRADISLVGTSGLINIPTAEILLDGEVCVGFSYIQRPYALYGRPDYNNIAYYCSLGYLPFLEISLRVTRKVNNEYPLTGIGDRMASFRIRLIKERAVLPAIAFGIRDIPGGKNANHFNALYVVGSKTLQLPFNYKAGFHLGMGTDWLESNEHHLVGTFGGVDLKINKFITLMVEDDTEKINLGARLTFLSHIHLIVAYLNAEVVSGGINFSFRF